MGVLFSLWRCLFKLSFIQRKVIKKFTLINNERSRIKVFEPFEDLSKPITSINAMMISYGYVYK